MSKKVKEVILLLEINGWRQVRTRGDHRIFKKIGSSQTISVPGKESKDMPEGLYRGILRKANLK
jgi:predicted RNA binding protein YcfA (HicA-like mRNA interferase family)